MKNVFPIIDDHGNQINDEIGARISMIISSSKQQARKAEELFTLFIEKNGYIAWHIENGWFTTFSEGFDRANRMAAPKLYFTWFMDFNGAFGGRPPSIGEKMVIISPSDPDIERNSRSPFILHCYNVTNVTRRDGDGIYQKDSSQYSIYMDKIETRLAIFDNKVGYIFYVSTWNKFKNWISNIFTK